MPRQIRRIALVVAAAACSFRLGFCGEPPVQPPRIKAPTIALCAATRTTLGDANRYALTFEVSNPNAASLVYTGYAPDSFAPPLEAGQFMPLCGVELKRGGRWWPQPIGYCGVGLAELELKPGGSGLFAVTVPADDWQAVKVAFGNSAAFSAGGEKTTTEWSAEFSRDEIDRGRAEPAPHPAGLPAGRWTVMFANGVIEICEIRADGTAKATEPRRTSAGKAAVEGGSATIQFDDDRLERWTAVGERFVVEHWFPASRSPGAAPVVGIGERLP